MAEHHKSKGQGWFFLGFCVVVGLSSLLVGPDNLPFEVPYWVYILFLLMASSLPISERYAELMRYLSTVSIFCGICVIAGFAMSGSRVFTIAWSGAIVILSLQAITRIIIWTWSSFEQVKRCAKG